MKNKDKLFTKKNPYNIDDENNHLFFLAVKEDFIFQYNHNNDFRRIMDKMNFSINDLNSYDDIKNIPPIPTLYYKKHQMFSMKPSKRIITATSSGTSLGINKSIISLNFKSILRGIHMLKGVFNNRHLISSKPHRYVVFGYEYHHKNKLVIAKSNYGSTFFTPAISKDYALRYTKDGYKLDLENIKNKLIEYSKKKTPVRTVGLPAYTYFLLKQMKEKGIKIKLPKGSELTIGGGWKNFYQEKVDKKDFYNLVEEVIGIEEKNVIEIFSAVEHPIVYCDCLYHHFHIPKYSRVIIRDVNTLKPLKNGSIGLINLITPMVDATSILSVLTDDLGVIHDEPCPCGNNSPYLEILGRVGSKDVITCALGANEYLKEDN